MKTLQRVERHIIKPYNKNYNSLLLLANKTKNLYNYVNYLLRQDFITKKPQIKEYDLSKKLASEKQFDYKKLPSQTAQQTIKLLYKDWKSFFKCLKSYQKDKNKFTSNPKLPKYKRKGEKGHHIAIFTNQQAKIKQYKNFNKIVFPKSVNIKSIITKIDTNISSLKQIRIIPKATCFIVEIVYETNQLAINYVKNSFLSCDLGLNNFVTTIDTQSKQPLIINGKGIKSINQYYNKKKAYLQAIAKKSNNRFITKQLLKLLNFRENKLNDFLHKASNFLVKYCVKHSIETLIIGKNKEWKKEINLGAKNNQSFTSIPYENFISKLAYKCETYGINFVLTEENYTSKCDHLANEKMKHQEKYLGKRIKRGLFKSSTNKILNADVNGAIGIARKVFHNAVQTLVDSGTAFVPIKINLAF